MRKLAIFTSGFAAAIAVAVLLAPNLNRIVVGVVCAVIALLLMRLRRVLPNSIRRRALLCCIGMALGMLWTQGYDRLVLEPARRLDDTTIILTGMATDWPEETEYGIKVRVRAELPQGGHADAFLYLDSEYADLRPGDSVTTVAHCTFSDENGLGQVVTYHTSKGIFLLATAYGEAKITHPERIPLSTVPVYALRKLQRGIETAFPGRTQALVRAVVTGDRGELEPLVVSGLSRTGMTHTVAVSGMHLAFLAGVLNLLLGRRRQLTALVGIPVMILFVLMVGCPPSAVRAAVMLILLQLAPLLKREGDTPTSLMFALFLLLVHNPYACADIGLQLSFGAVAGIALFAQKLQDRMTAWLKPTKGIGALYYMAVRTIAAILAVTLGAQVFTVPLTAFYFDTVSLVSPIANVVSVWSVSALFVLGVIGGCFGMLIPSVAGVVGLIAVPLESYVRHVVTALASIPFAAIPARPELYRLWLVLLYLLLVLGLLLPGRKHMMLPGISVVLTLVVAVFCTVMQLRAAPMRVDVLDVGQGQSVLVYSGNKFALLDCGGDGYSNPGDVAADRLQCYGSSMLDLLVVSHYHDDHANGVLELLDRVDVKCVVLPDVQEDSELRQKIVARAEQAGAWILFVREDIELDLGETTITIYPPLGEGDANELGLTVLCSVQDYDMLITGDMKANSEWRLLDYAKLPDVELMLAGHHGSKFSNSEQLLTAVQPEVVICSVGAFNWYGHPTQEALERFAAVGAEIYRTDTAGTITLTVKPTKKGA